MNSLSRLLALATFVVLAALVAVLAMPVWQQFRSGSPPPATETSATTAVATAPTPPSPGQRAIMLSQRVGLVLAVIALVLTLPLLLSAVSRPTRSQDTPPSFDDNRAEVSALARLAESSVAQGAELTRERDVRRRAEEDAQLKQQLLAHELEEKIRLGRDLHDGIIQSVYAAGLTLESVRPLVKTDPEETVRRLDQIRSGLNDTIRDIRGYIAGLAPEHLRRAGLTHALTHLLDELRAGYAVQFEVNVDEEAAAQLTPEQSVEVLQIAREAASNALRHGQASKVTVRMHQGDQAVCLLVQDTGNGFDAVQAGNGGHGLANMRARAERIGASLRITSQPGAGTRVLATLPVSPTRPS